MKKDNNNKKQGMLARFASYYKPYKKVFALDILCAFMVSMIDLAFPLATRSAIENLLPNEAYRSFFIFIAIMIVLYLIRMVMNYSITYFGHIMGAKMEADMRKDIFTHMQKLSFSFFDNHRTGQLMSRVTTDLNEVTELAHHGPEDLFISVVTIIGSLIALFTIQWKLALIFLVVLPLILAFSVLMRKRMQDSNSEVKSALAGINSKLEGSISGIREAQSYGNEDFEVDQFENSNEKFRVAKKGFYKDIAIFHSVLDFCLNIMYVLVIAVGGYLIMKKQMQIYDLLTFTLFINVFLTPVRKVGVLSEQYAAGIAGFSRMVELLDTEPEIAEKKSAIELGSVRGDIEFDDVSFSYDSDDRYVLKNMSFKINAGEKVALVGSSGGGKTTICQLIPRFYDVDGGSVKVDDYDIKDLTISSLRSHIGFVRQDVLIFAGTIKSNIEYGDLESDDNSVISAAKKAEIHDFIMSLQDGYDTYVGERGVMLSGGQKQRIAIARAFLKNPKILILDEATSALDTLTERKIQLSLEELATGRTTLIIAHRLSTIENADKIIVVGEDGISEMGTHDELVALKGEYYKMHNLQEFV